MMIEPRIPKYQWGQRVKALIDLFNDGSFPDTPVDARLVASAIPVRSSRWARRQR
jgi:nitrogen fixation protein NifZ